MIQILETSSDKSLALRLRPLAPLFFIAIVIVVIELALEWRHHNRCYRTLVFGKPDCQQALADSRTPRSFENTPFGPTPAWPFRSLVPTKSDGWQDNIWIASASHAEHSRLPAKQVFPNLICKARKIRGEFCFVVNGSRAGFTIADNVNLMAEWSAPSMSILYQMAIPIAQQQNALVAERIEAADTEHKSSAYDDALTILKRLLQRSSLYLHLSEYIGGSIRLASFRDSSLPGAAARYLEEVGRFVYHCQQRGIIPVLTTFAIAYDNMNIDLMPISQQRTLVRENKILSVQGYANTVAELNDAITQYAEKHSLHLIDLASVIGGRPQLFVDMVHFNADGHQRLAVAIANYLDSLEKVKSREF